MISTYCDARVASESTPTGACAMKLDLDLDSLLGEPIVQLMMKRDGIASGDVRQIVQKVMSARALRARGIEPPDTREPADTRSTQTVAGHARVTDSVGT
jgi:hypothetical protein